MRGPEDSRLRSLLNEIQEANSGTVALILELEEALSKARQAEELQRVNEELTRLYHMKEDFLSTVSHELRTPLTNMKMAITLLKILLADAIEDNAKVRQYFDILTASCERELNLVNDLLDLSRVEQYAVNLAVLNPADLLTSIAEPFIDRASQNQQLLAIQIQPLPSITTDRSLLERVINELLNNACKYTPPGEHIVLDARVNGGRRLIITICNTGITIPESSRQQVFDRFYRVPNGDPWKHGGTGLGLALVKEIISKLQGQISLDCESQRVCFIVSLPVNGGISS